MSSPASDRPARLTGPHSVLRKDVLRKGDLPALDEGDMADAEWRRDPARQTGPRRKAEGDAERGDESVNGSDDLDFGGSANGPGLVDSDGQVGPPAGGTDSAPAEALPPMRPRALSIPYATLPSNKTANPPQVTAAAEDGDRPSFPPSRGASPVLNRGALPDMPAAKASLSPSRGASDLSSVIPPAAPLPRDVGRTPAASPRGVSRTPSVPSRSYLSRQSCRRHGLALNDRGTCLRCEKEWAAQRAAQVTWFWVTVVALAVGIAAWFAFRR